MSLYFYSSRENERKSLQQKIALTAIHRLALVSAFGMGLICSTPSFSNTNQQGERPLESPQANEPQKETEQSSEQIDDPRPKFEDALEGEEVDAHSEPVGDPAQYNGLPIDSITIRNDVGRTRPAFILAKLGLRALMPFRAAELNAGLDRLVDTRIFKTVSAEVFARGNGVHIELTVDEKWTLLPDIRFGGGGGTAFFRFGLFDINWFGLGGQGLISYENRNGTHNGDAWLRYPKFLGGPVLVGAGITRSTTLLTDYGPKGDVLGGEAYQSTRLLADFEWDPFSYLTFGYRMEPEWLFFNHDQISSAVKEANLQSGREPTPSSRRVLHRFSLRWHGLEYSGVLREGHEIIIYYIPSFAGFATDRSSLITRSDFKYFFLFPFETNLALRLVVATGSDTRPENLQSIGGLSEVRGYLDGEFRAQTVGFGNAEIRKNLFETRSFVWQAATFYDFGLAAENVSQLLDSQLRDSVGIGFRIVPDFIHLAALRLDYAMGLSDSRNDGGLSFGVLQFF